MTPVEAESAAELRVIETMPEGYLLEADGTELQWGPAVDTRLRLGVDLGYENLRLALETDLFSGQLLGATWDLPSIDERGRDTRDALTLAGVVPRQASVGVRSPWFDVQGGLQLSQWGLGMLANDGAGDPLFGRTDMGDRVIRLRLATQPLERAGERVPLYLILAGDRVVADELARVAEDDVAWQAVAALLYRVDDDQAGLYAVIRDQVDADDRHTGAHVLDAFVDTAIPLGSAVVGLAAEGAWIGGRTTVSRTYTAPDGVRIGSGGLAVRTRLELGRWTAHLRGALASGDRSADDGRVGDFRFDRDYDVGFVLFDEVLSAIDLDAWRQITDPSAAGTPPDGADSLAAEGAFHQAAALQPAVAVAPLRWLGLRAGAVFAWSTAPIAQPYTSFRSGGVPTNHLGAPADGRYLGTELDWAIGTREEGVADWRIRPSAEIQVGHAWPSRALSGGIERVDHLLLVARARY